MDNFELAKRYFLEGVNLLESGHFEKAEKQFNQSLHHLPDRVSTLTNLSATQIKLTKYSEAKNSSEKALALEPENAEAYLNLGLIAKEEGLLILAIEYFSKAQDINPIITQGCLNKGAALKDLKRYDEALAAYEKALTINPNYAEAWSNKGVVYGDLKRYDEALAAYEKALQLKPSPNYLLGQYIHTKMLVGNWIGMDSLVNTLSMGIASGLKVGSPFVVLSVLDEPKLHLETSKIWIDHKCPSNLSLQLIHKKPHSKIRIGYFSADFGDHPVSHLTSELFKLHNREYFEVIALSLKNAGKNDLIREKLIHNFDQFIDVDNKSDFEIAQLSRDMEIDIAIDMGGHTQGARTGIFSYRAAPIQVNYLGYPGTIGADYIDYIIADHIVIPESNRPYFTEKIAYLPDTYMVDDRTRKISQKEFTREDFGLPSDGIVFCAFNNSYKFNRQLLESWARILAKVPNSILWISENSPFFRRNMLDAFINLGVDLNRIIFAKRLESAQDHLKRHQLADLFLDTSPYNAHTTAVDALRAGLPIVTLLGNAFAGRVAASLLTAIGLQRLITNTCEEYESLVIELATRPQQLKELKEQLQTKLTTASLFNTPLFVKNIEAAYTEMYKRYQNGLGPDHIDIKGRQLT